MNIKRELTRHLIQWAQKDSRRPLVLKGARQVGKSHVVREFGKSNFSSLLEVNLELKQHLRPAFASLNPKIICQALSVEFNHQIVPGKTLLFIDEIQEIPEAFSALRYFYEQLPELHVICAGSMLDLVLERTRNLRMPVGRVEYMHMFPLSFTEFLKAKGEDLAFQLIRQISLDEPIDETTHARLLSLFREYLLSGGMPAVVSSYLKNPESGLYRRMQSDLIQGYKDDFPKYRTQIDLDRLQYIFARLPNYVGRPFKLNELCPAYSQQTCKAILSLLSKSHIVHPILLTSANGLPLGSQIGETRSNKYLFLDVGLMLSAQNLTKEIILSWNTEFAASGAIAEQVVGQELLAYSDPHFEPRSYYWARDKKGSSAEIDFITSQQNRLVPIEVKAGATGKLKSLRIFMQEKGVTVGVRISQHQLSLTDGILSVPFYAISSLGSLLESTRTTSP